MMYNWQIKHQQNNGQQPDISVKENIHTHNTKVALYLGYMAGKKVPW